MHKTIFKKLLCKIDAIELYETSVETLANALFKNFDKDNEPFALHEITYMLSYLQRIQMLIHFESGIDLAPAITIFSKSDQDTILEAVSLFESLLHEKRLYDFFHKQIRCNSFISMKQLKEQIDSDSLQLLTQTILIERKQNQVRIQPSILKHCLTVMLEYENKTLLISAYLLALYTVHAIAQHDDTLDYKNQDYKIIEYPYQQMILKILPKRGIPFNRDTAKHLQAFYKDTLFHEFHHMCPICHIHLPHMLIASHIKPFRDCAHIYEAVDHNNGILLCRNHDYLFDQGYISFSNEGTLLLSNALSKMSNVYEMFCIQQNCSLNKKILTHERKLFLAYHRMNIFKLHV